MSQDYYHDVTLVIKNMINYYNKLIRHVKVMVKKITIEPRREKTNALDSDLVIHKPGCTAMEDC